MSFLINPYRFAAPTVVNGITANASSTTNPNGDWSYIRKPLITSSTVNTLTYSGTPGSWVGPEAFSLPILQAGASILMHPGDLSTTVAIRWTSPVAAIVQVAATFVKDTTTGASNGVLVGAIKNNTTNVYGPTLINTSTTTATFTGGSVSVAVGDVLDFYVNNNGSFASDHTNVTLLTLTY
jgi:hypothetical protein